MANPWNDCKTNKPELGRKVLCCKNGDVYTASRFEDEYFCFPFLHSEFAKSCMYPQQWQVIDFPSGLHGRYLISPPSSFNVMNMTEYKEHDKEGYLKLYNALLEQVEKGHATASNLFV